MNDKEVSNGNTAVIHPISDQQENKTPPRKVFGKSSKPAELDESPMRRGPFSFLTPDRKKKNKLSTPSTGNKLSATPVIRNGKTPDRYVTLNNNRKYGSAKSLTAERKQFDYDEVFDVDVTQREVYDRSVGDAVRRNIFRGFNTTIIAYGQTGSGKTHTMFGRHDAELAALSELSPSSRDSVRKSMNFGSDVMSSTPNERVISINDDDGIIPRAVNDLFKAKQRHESAGEVTIQLTYLEIYNDELRDLLAEEDVAVTANLKLRDNGDEGVIVSGLSSATVNSVGQVKKLMEQASSRRITATTRMNMRSSRSHSICTILVTVKPATRTKSSAKSTRAEVVTAKLTLVDLAGSERIKQTGVVGIQQQESININKDLFVLAKVISALAEKGKKSKAANKVHVPYRDSKLTRLLRDSLGGNCCTVMVACISPASGNLEESINTLRYAERTRSITNSIKQNVEKALMTPEECAVMRGENQMLKNKLMDLKARISQLETGRDHPESTAPVSSFADDDIESVDSMRHRNAMQAYLDTEISKKKTLVANLRKEAKELTVSLESVSSKRADLSRQPVSTENSLLQESHLKRIESYKAEITSLLGQIALLQNRKAKLASEVAAQEEHLSELRRKTFQSTTQSRTSRSGTGLLSRLGSRCETDMKFEMVELKSGNENSLVNEVAAKTGLERKLGDAEMVNKRLVEELNGLKHHMNEEAALIQKLSAEKRQCADYKANLDKANAELETLLAEKDEFRVTIVVNEDTIGKLNQDLEAVRVRLQLVEEEKAELQQKLDDKENDVSSVLFPYGRPGSRKVLVELNQQANSEGSEGLVKSSPSTKRNHNEEESVKNTSFDDSTIDTEEDISIESDHKAIREHAAKMLFWANKAISRGKGPRSIASSLASSHGSEFLPVPTGARPAAQKADTVPGKPPRAIVTTNDESRKPPPSPSKEMIISNLNQMKDLDGPCTCQSSLFSGNAGHVDFYLPKLGMACSCGKQQPDKNLASEGENPLVIESILRPWQVNFLKSVGIHTAEQLVKTHNRRGDALAKDMRKWRKAKKLTSVKTRSCGIALHIWARTCKAVVRSVRKQQAEGAKVILKPDFLDVSIPSDQRTVSTLGCGSFGVVENAMVGEM